MIKIKQFTFSLFEVNTYLFIDKDTKKTAVIDPAMMNENEYKEFDDYIKTEGLEITQVINTHMHLDHCFGLNYVKTKYGVASKAHGSDKMLADLIDQQYLMFGMRPNGKKLTIDVELKDGEEIEVGHEKLKVIYTPGHTEGGIALYCAAGGLLFSGDTLFKGSIGRTDLPGGNHATLIRSIKTRLMELPDSVKVLPGHGPITTIGEEKRLNQFLR